VRAEPDRGADDDRPTVLLLHGWTVTADTTFAPTYPALADRYRVVAHDQRGHGRGLPVGGRVDLTELADDAAAVLDALEVGRALVVGYSMGGAVAQLLWQRHAERVAGLVLCSTARHFRGGRSTDVWFRGQDVVAPAVRAWPALARARMQRAVEAKVTTGPHAEWYRRELLRSDPASVLRVGAALGRFRSTEWLGAIDVPTAVVATTADLVVPTARQRALAAAIPGASLYEVDGPHDSAVSRSERWVPVLRRALDDVHDRSRGTAGAGDAAAG
jgi:3-oxoadipate enol-lactonase